MLVKQLGRACASMQSILVGVVCLAAIGVAAADKPRAPMATPGAFQVTPSGAAAFSIPIQIPSGIAGVEPKIGLEYDSSGGPGLAGQGWGLSGLSVISRCPQNPAYDNAFGYVSYTASDRFCMDGQRLVSVNGVYGAANTEYRTYNNTFSKITSYGSQGNGPAYFVVKTKAGVTMEYGNSTDSFIEAAGQTTARVWALRQVRDTKGNYVVFNYTEEAGGDYYPSSITYTGNDVVNQAPTNTVAFTYDNRSDTQVNYQGGAAVTRTKRLAKITTSQSGNVINQYQLTYAAPSAVPNQRSALTKVQRCNAAGTSCLAATTMEYPALASGFAQTVKAMNQQGVYGADQQWFISDFDGDGKSDLVNVFNDNGLVSIDVHPGGSAGLPTVRWLTQTGGWTGTTAYTSQAWFVGDVNGDGRPDVVHGITDVMTYRVQVYINTGSGFSMQDWLPSTPYKSNLFDQVSVRWYGLNDTNGDGAPEMHLAVGSSTNPTLYILPNNRNAFGSPVSVISSPGYNLTAMNFSFADFNGDGRSDVIQYSSSGGLSGSYHGSGLTYQIATYSSVSNINPFTSFLFDVNNDGRADWMYTKSDNGSVTIGVQVNTGAGWGGASNWANQLGSHPTNFRWIPGDVNADGLPDLVLVWGDASTTSIDVFLNTGNSYVRSTWLNAVAIPFSAADRWMAADMNGDGKTDVVRVYNDNGNASADVYLSNASDVLVTKFNNGVGGSTSVTYATISDSTLYTRGTGSTYPVIELQVPMRVVKSVQMSDGVGGVLATNYSYSGLRSELGTGRGSLGFASVTSKQADTGLTLINQYRQDWPYTGMASLIRKQITPPSGGATVILGQTNITYACKPCTFNGTPYFLYESERIEQAQDLNGAALPASATTMTFDDHGNPLTVTVNTSDGYSKVTNNTYTNDTANWFLGRLTRSTVTHVKP